jgi:hypothetical protein
MKGGAETPATSENKPIKSPEFTFNNSYSKIEQPKINTLEQQYIKIQSRCVKMYK